jgi:amino acid transporter
LRSLGFAGSTPNWLHDPIAGGSTCSYATLEIFAWIIGWDLILEYVVSNVAVAIGFSGYAKARLAALASTCPVSGQVRCGRRGSGRARILIFRLPDRFYPDVAAGRE